MVSKEEELNSLNLQKMFVLVEFERIAKLYNAKLENLVVTLKSIDAEIKRLQSDET